MNVKQPGGGQAGFSMIEISVCLLVIVIGLVAVLGVLPAGMEARRKIRSETLMDMEGRYFLEAIRNGADLFPAGRFVDGMYSNKFTFGWNKGSDQDKVIGFLSQPNTTNQARIRLQTGVLSEKSRIIEDFALSYVLTTEIVPYTGYYVETNTALPSYDAKKVEEAGHLATNLYEIRLTIDWPASGSGTNLISGPNRKLFRAMTSSVLVKGTNKVGATDHPYYLFRPDSYIRGGQNP